MHNLQSYEQDKQVCKENIVLFLAFPIRNSAPKVLELVIIVLVQLLGVVQVQDAIIAGFCCRIFKQPALCEVSL